MMTKRPFLKVVGQDDGPPSGMEEPHKVLEKLQEIHDAWAKEAIKPTGFVILAEFGQEIDNIAYPNSPFFAWGAIDFAWKLYQSHEKIDLEEELT